MRNSILNRYVNDKHGQFALITAVLAVPIVISVGVAVDSSMNSRNQAHLQTSLDTAALASVVPGNLTDNQREAYAIDVFKANFKDQDGITNLRAVASGPWVQINAKYQSAPLLKELMGKGTNAIGRTSTALRESEDVICVMTLSEDQEGSLAIENDAIINAPGCSIQVNSTNKQALKSTGYNRPTAKSICVAGGVQGAFASNIKANCTPQEDPYAHLNVRVPSSLAECDYGPISLFNPSTFGEVIDVGETQSVRTPGVYCNGLHISDSNVKLMPGTYYIHDGPLSIGNNSFVQGEDVTFVFTGEGSFLYTYDNFDLDLKAPDKGKYAGLIFAQDRHSSTDETSIIKGDANIKLVGTTYLPTQDLYVGGTGELGSNSPAMAFISENMTFTSDIDQIITESEKKLQLYITGIQYLASLFGYSGNVNGHLVPDSDPLATRFTTNIKTTYTSHAEEGLPEILPRSDGGARLVSNELVPPQN